MTWYDGKNNNPRVPEAYGGIKIDRSVPSINGRVQPAQELPAGKEIYGGDLTFKGASHGSTLSIIPDDRAKDLAGKLPEFRANPTNHFANFLKASKGQEECLSPFSVSGPLSQVFSLGTLAQRLNERLVFNRKSKQITNHSLANQWLKGPAPRPGWEEFYRMA